MRASVSSVRFPGDAVAKRPVRARSSVLFLVCVLAVSFPQSAHGQALIVRHATLLDGTGGPPHEAVDICVLDGLIQNVAKGCTVPGEAPIIDARGLHLIPGFVDMHVHLLEHGRDEKGEIPTRVDWNLVRRHLRLLLHHGVTTVRDPGSETEAAVTLRAMLERGDVTGPRLLTAGRILTASAFHQEPFLSITTADDVRREVRWQKTAGVDFIKLYSSMPPELTKIAIEEAKALGMPV